MEPVAAPVERHPVAPIPSSPPACAAHPERATSVHCDRCGNFLCADCAHDSPWGYETYCGACLALLEAQGGGGRIPWEEPGPFFARFWATVYDVLTEPGELFRRMSSRGWLPAVTFQLQAIFYASVLALAGWWLITRMRFGVSVGLGTLAISLGIAVALAPIWQVVTAAWLHLFLYLFGARRGYECTYRYLSYASALGVVYGVALVVGWIPIVGFIVPWVLLAWVLVVLSIGAARAQRIPVYSAAVAVVLNAGLTFVLSRYVIGPLLG